MQPKTKARQQIVFNLTEFKKRFFVQSRSYSLFKKKMFLLRNTTLMVCWQLIKTNNSTLSHFRTISGYKLDEHLNLDIKHLQQIAFYTLIVLMQHLDVCFFGKFVLFTYVTLGWAVGLYMMLFWKNTYNNSISIICFTLFSKFTEKWNVWVENYKNSRKQLETDTLNAKEANLWITRQNFNNMLKELGVDKLCLCWKCWSLALNWQ